MSIKNSKDNKKLRTLERALRKGRVLTKFDLYEWLKVRGYANSNRDCEKLIMEGRVKVNANRIGTRVIDIHGNPEKPLSVTEKREVFDRYIYSTLKSDLLVTEKKDGEAVSNN